MKMNPEYIRLIKNIGFLIIIGIIVSFVISYFVGNSSDDSDQIADTPIRVEQVKRIAEISSVSYTDEIVVDSVEYFKELEEISDWLDAIELSQRVLQRNVKRRLTLIVKGEVKMGFDLKSKSLKALRNGDTLYLSIPQPTLLEINLSPSGTEIYQEQGNWKDSERRKLENKAKLILIENSKRYGLKKKAEDSATRLFKRLLKDEKYVEIEFI
jgi:hypothetical protein